MSRYETEVKAAVMAALLQGQSISSLAKEYNIPKGTISNWKNRPKSETQKRDAEIGQLITEYLAENLITLKAQAVFFRNEKWLVKQDASANAVLHGVMADKSIKLLEAFSANDNDQETED